MSPTMTKQRCPPIEINVGHGIHAVIFSANGEYLVSGGREAVQVWRVEDGKKMVTLETGHARCLAASPDGRWIAAGTGWGNVFVWDARTYKLISSHGEDYCAIHEIDFSPDSTRLVGASENCAASIWNATTRERVVGPLLHKHCLTAVRYSPQGDRVATATCNSVRIYDSKDGRLLVEIPVDTTPSCNTGLFWSEKQLVAVSDGKIKQIEASTGLVVSEWPVPGAGHYTCTVLPKHGKFIASSINRAVTFWDTSTHVQVALVQGPQDTRSIAISPDSRFIAFLVGGEDGNITVKQPSFIVEPDIRIGDTVLYLWKQGHLVNADALLTAEILHFQGPGHHTLASRALVRAHLGQWDAAIGDANESISIQPSVIGYIAKSVALVGKGEKLKAYRVCDIAFEIFHSSHASFLLLIKAIIVFVAGEYDDAISRIADLIDTVQFNSIFRLVQAYMYFLLGSWRMERGDYKGSMQWFERARAQIQPHTSQALLVVSLISGWAFDDLDIMVRQYLCEALYAAGRVKEACESLINIATTIDKEVYMTEQMTIWATDFVERCLSTLEDSGGIILHSPLDSPLLREWEKLKLTSSSWKEALVAATSFTIPRFIAYQAVCEHLETLGQLTVATECFHQMMSELGGEKSLYEEQVKWILSFKQRLSKKLECLGDATMSSEQHDKAISEYSAAISLHPTAPQNLFVKRSKAYVSLGLWEDALTDANKVIALDPSSPWGYERKHAALHKAKRYDDAIDAFETMLLKISQSSDPEIRERHCEYINPERTKGAIRVAIQNAIRDSPLVLINTDSGRLLDKSGQASSFESQSAFKELISSMTTHVDRIRIKHEVEQYYRYATFSHKWEDHEPLFEQVVHLAVYDLEESPTHDKLQMFCKIVRDAGFHWAWSDTCCINKADHFVLQEALVAMFKWYEGSALTIVFLRGVRSPSKHGDLVRSIWNTRAWTLQEYHASKVIRFYTEDWEPYLNLDNANHKESPEIISEMEEATGVSAQALMALRPGLDDIREKLHLASTRHMTRIEDAAYSLLGIFSMSIPVVYGEGDKALGRFLAQLLMSSGDTSILAWRGRSGGFNSCLPSTTTVFNELPTTHIPPALEVAEMDTVTTTLQASPLDFTLVMKLYDQLNELAVPFYVGQRMKLPCIIFKLGTLSVSRFRSGYIFRAQTAVLGAVQIRTTEDLSRLHSLYLVHPWIDFLLDRQPVGSVEEMISEEYTNDQSSIADFQSFTGPPEITSVVSRTRASWTLGFGWPFGEQPTETRRYAPSLLPPSSLSPAEKQMRALQVIARLRQPFGALLLTPNLSKVASYRRVAAESLITVHVEEITSTILNKLVHSVRTLDVL